ncbi:MAG: hypothetical protein JST86_01365 [Bacteroidetes bacterium]|nr:hypothetical protein [Bacteroidota bacterium]
MVVYNTASAGTSPNIVSPGLYYCDGTKWLRLISEGYTSPKEVWRNAVTQTAADSTSTNIVFNKGNVGINTGANAPAAKLEVDGTLMIKDGTQGANKTLVSDNNGLAHWVATAGTVVSAQAVLNTSGASLNGTTVPVSTGSYIDLAPGKWLVNIVMLASNGGNQVPFGQGIWLRSSLSNTAGGTTVSPDIIGSWLVSGTLAYPMRYGLVNGILFINNTSATTKRYYYYAWGESMPGTPTGFAVTNFGSTQWGEDQIYGVPIN